MNKTILAFVIALVVTFTTTSVVFALADKHAGVSSVDTYRTYALIDESEESATSSVKVIAGAESITLYLENDGPYGSGVGTSTVTFEVSLDGTTYFDYNKLITNDTSLTRASSAVLTSTTTASYTMDLSGESYYSFRVVGVEAGTTTLSVDALIQY